VDFDAKEAGLKGLVGWVRQTFANNPRAPVRGDVGHYAAILDLPGQSIDLAFSTDGVGTKILVAELADKHDTIGIDCIAMNANDLVCVGAEPIAMVDYLAVEQSDPVVLDALGRGLAEGAKQAEISIPGGELALVPSMIRGVAPGKGYDLVGSCVGLLEKGGLIDGTRMAAGDAVVGIASTGVHSNGYSLVRKVIFSDMNLTVNDHLEDCGRSVGEELLEPTAMYVRESKALINSDCDLRALYNITGGGFLNLRRMGKNLGFRLDAMPTPQPIFSVMQDGGKVTDGEMHAVFNMGIGFVAVVPQGDADKVIAAAKAEGKDASVIGQVVDDEQGRVFIERDGLRLVSQDETFVAVDAPPAGFAS
jgi:phosphoribosylformylglycinamidine cyclo-ligase